MRTATSYGKYWRFCCRHFNPRGPCGPRLIWTLGRSIRGYFNPRGPCGPRPGTNSGAIAIHSNFNPRGPCGPRQCSSIPGLCACHISILAVLADRDTQPNPEIIISTEFQSSRSLRTATLLVLLLVLRMIFQSSRSLRTATKAMQFNAAEAAKFQSSRSLRTATSSSSCRYWTYSYFNPRGPCGPRL